MTINNERKVALLKLAEMSAVEDDSVQTKGLNKFLEEIEKTTPFGIPKNHDGKLIMTVAWGKVEQLGEDLLKNGYKDLKVIGFFGEALFRLYDLDGLEVSCRIFQEIVKNSWEDVLPKPSDDDEREHVRRNFILDTAKRWADVPFPSVENESTEDLNRCLEAITGLEMALSGKFSMKAPNFNMLATVLKAKIPSPPSAIKDTTAISDEQSNALVEDGKTGKTTFPMHPQNRDDAFAMLSVVAHYFAKNEPHSPIPYVLEQAIRWGSMRFPDLMDDLLLNHKSVCQEVFRATGVTGVQVKT